MYIYIYFTYISGALFRGCLSIPARITKFDWFLHYLMFVRSVHVFGKLDFTVAAGIMNKLRMISNI